MKKLEKHLPDPGNDPVDSLFSGSGLFASLERRHREALAPHCQILAFTKDSLIFMAGDEARGVYVVLDGRVKVFRLSPDGKEAVLHLFGGGEMFGEAAVFEGGAFPANAQAVEGVRTLFLSRSGLVQAISADPSLALALLAAFARRLRGFVHKVEALTLMETPQRLAAFLLLESGERGGAASFRLDISKGLLAAMLGTARETLSRCLSRFAEQGLIALDGRAVRILDRAGLEKLAEGGEPLP